MGQSHFGSTGLVCLNNITEVHPIQLIARENQHIVVVFVVEMLQIPTHCIRRALIPIIGLVRLLSGKDIHEAAAKLIQVVGVLDMPVEGSRMKLGKNKNTVYPRIQTVADRNIDQTILAGQRHRRFTAF